MRIIIETQTIAEAKDVAETLQGLMAEDGYWFRSLRAERTEDKAQISIVFSTPEERAREGA